jgi:hypothetical protein
VVLGEKCRIEALSTKHTFFATSTAVTVSCSTVVLACLRGTWRIGAAMWSGDRTEVATWQRSGWKTWWLVLSMRSTRAGAFLKARAAARPPNPAPTMMIQCSRAVVAEMESMVKSSEVG